MAYLELSVSSGLPNEEGSLVCVKHFRIRNM